MPKLGCRKAEDTYDVFELPGAGRVIDDQAPEARNEPQQDRVIG